MFTRQWTSGVGPSYTDDLLRNAVTEMMSAMLQNTHSQRQRLTCTCYPRLA